MEEGEDPAIAPERERLGTGVDEDGDGFIDELDRAERVFPHGLADVGPAEDGALWVATESAQGVYVYAPPDPADPDWADESPIGWREDRLCCSTDTRFWGPDLDGDGKGELYVAWDNEYWSYSFYIYQSMVYPWSAVTAGVFSVSDRLAVVEGGLVGWQAGADGSARILSQSGGAVLFGVEAFADGVATESEAVASVLDVNVHPMVGSTAISGGMGDLTGDGIADLVVDRFPDPVNAPSQPVVLSGVDLDAPGLDASIAQATLKLQPPTVYVASGAVADVNGDGNADILLAVRTEEAQVWGAAAVLFVGPFAGEVEPLASVAFSSPTEAWPGRTASLGDLDGDGRAEMGVGFSGEFDAEGQAESFAFYSGALLSAGGELDFLEDLWAYRAVPGFGTAATDVYAGDLDGDARVDLAVRLRDPMLGAAPSGLTWGAEVYLDLAGR